jgi:hypothetical protein
VRSSLRSSLAALALLPAAAFAQTPTAPAAPAAAAPAEPPKPPPWYTQVTVNGSVDAFYQLRLDAAQDAPVAGRAFDGFTGFVPGSARLGFGIAPAPAGFRIDLGFGQTANVIDGVSGGGGAGKYVQQAYAAMKLGPAEVDVGRFTTSAGAEVIDAKDNWLYSRSVTFNLEPLTHTGLRVTAPLGETLSLTVGVNNGWDVVAAAYPGKTGQLSLAWTGPSSSTLGLNVYVGENPTTWSGAANTAGQIRTFADFVGGVTAGPLDLSVNFDWATEAADAYWAGSAMARYHVAGDVARITGRFEYAKDLGGVRFAGGVKDGSLWEATLGVSVPVGGSSELRIEGRYDKSSDQLLAFNKGSPTDSQLTGTIAALAWF